MIKQQRNVLYVQEYGAYLRLKRDTVFVEVNKKKALQIPLHHLSSLVLFGNTRISTQLLQRCAEEGHSVAWYSYGGRFKGRLTGPTAGNVLLRRAQHKTLDAHDARLDLAKRFVLGKIRNSRSIMQRAARDYDEVNSSLSLASNHLRALLPALDRATTLDQVRGLEGQAASIYFSNFRALIRRDEFEFSKRIRRPPRDPINCLLSFAYSMLTNDCTAALEGVGLDPQVGYLHALRPGRPSLALDLMEELRPILADRLVITLINRGQIRLSDFKERPGGAILLEHDGRKAFLKAYQNRKREEILHPVLNDRIALSLVPHVQARFLARHLRQDGSEYKPFMPK